MDRKTNSDRLGNIVKEDIAKGTENMDEIMAEKREEEENITDEDKDFGYGNSAQKSTKIIKQISLNYNEKGSPNDVKDTSSSDTSKNKREKRMIQIDWPTEIEAESTERRRTIYELDSYAASNISVAESCEAGEMSDADLDEPQISRYSKSLAMPGLARIKISPLTQKIVGCVIGDNVTTEYPWIYVRKELIEDNLDLYADSSDFLPVKNEVAIYPDKNMLIGYAPSPNDERQFYICLNESGRDAVVKHIENLRLTQEDRVRNAVHKAIGQWTDLGSSVEVDNTIVKKTRTLFEIEVESASELLNARIKLIDRNVGDQRDGYVELLPYRQTFDNVTRRLVSKGELASLPLVDNNAQTEPSMRFNSWFQYNYEYTGINTTTYNEDETHAMKRFLRKCTKDMCDKVQQNSTWDIYTDEYVNLVRNEKDTLAPSPTAYTEHQSYYDKQFSMDKVISDLCWHPLWTGIAAAAYAEHAKSENLIGPYPHDEVLKGCKGNNKVLIWSFNDCLTPKLILECSREVTAVSFCPLDGNIIIGGCASGQIAIWSILGKIELVEALMVQTTSQVKYRTAMRSLMSWMRESTTTSILKPTAMSSLHYSHKAPITEIVWLPAYDEVDKNGKIGSLSGDSSVKKLSWQLATSSEDGTIAFWNLRWRPSEDKDKAGLQGKQKKKTIQRPGPLVQSISSFKALDGILRPVYMLEVNYPHEERRVIITTMNIYSPKIQKEQTEPFPSSKDNETLRKYYKPLIEKPYYQLEPKILIGTVEGDVARVTWEGYKFSTGLIVNREHAQWIWENRNIHDGPVTHSVRSKYLNDVLVTIGGKIFAVWREDYGEPVFWRKSNVRYTACSWGTFRPTVLIMARGDGSAEIWDFIVKSHEPSFIQGVSGRIITGIHTHELYLNPQCVAFCDFNGTLRIFTAPADLLNFDESDIDWMRKFIDREVDRIREFKLWGQAWNHTNEENVEKRKKLAEFATEQKSLEITGKAKAKIDEVMKKQEFSKIATSSRKPGEFLDEARDRWRSMELKRMQQVILEKKGLSADILDRQRAPILRLRQDAKRKEQKIHEIMEQQDKIFADTTAFLFPEQYKYDRRSTVAQSLSGSQKEEETTAEIKVLMDEEPTRKYIRPEQEIMNDFMEVEKEVLASMKKNSYEPDVEWRKVLCEGKVRRRTMDIGLTRSNRPKGRKFSQELLEMFEPSTHRNTASGNEVYEAPSNANEADP